MNLTPEDILCCPPPLFHCFGLTLGLLATLSHGGKIVFPSESFDPVATMHAISDERCTALHGVPAMMETIINVEKPSGWISELRTGIVAGSPVPRWLMERMVEELGMTDFTSSYGLTVASPTVFNAHTTDSLHAATRTRQDCRPQEPNRSHWRPGRVMRGRISGMSRILGEPGEDGGTTRKRRTRRAVVTYRR
jgi:acyl-CoA synthetase (AMP-forming)/AMP-acid ligase II